MLTEAVSRIGMASPNVVICQRDDLVAEHVGGSERKTREILKKASGGVLVVDEVYRLNVKARDFGQEVVETLMRYMIPGDEATYNVPAPAMMIFVGYHHLMDKFLKMNQGLSRRIPHRVHLQDFTAQEILTISFNILRDEVGLDTSKVEAADFGEELYMLEDEIPNKNASLARELAYKIDEITQVSLCSLPHEKRLKLSKRLRKEDVKQALSSFE